MIEQGVCAGTNLVFMREFIWLLSQDFEKRYDCSVTRLEGGNVRVVLNEASLEIDANVAGELAFCLSEAIYFSEILDVFKVTAAIRENGVLERRYRLLFDKWQFSAEGIVDFIDANFWVTCEEGNKMQISISFILGSIVLDFEQSTYYLSNQDASWLQEKLLLASRQTLEVSSPRYLLADALFHECR